MSEYENYRNLIKIDPHNLQYVPEESRTPELCELAVNRSCSEALQFVPEKYKTLELSLITIRMNSVGMLDEIWPMIPDEHKTKAFFDSLLEDGDIFEYHIPEEYRHLISTSTSN